MDVENIPYSHLKKRKKKMEILVKYGVKRKIAKLFSCSDRFVGQALQYIANSEKARRIRYMAIKDFKGVKIGE